jgi:hypothetical protein
MVLKTIWGARYHFSPFHPRVNWDEEECKKISLIKIDLRASYHEPNNALSMAEIDVYNIHTRVLYDLDLIVQ